MLSWFEEMAIQIVLGLVRQLIKNPAKATAARTMLLHIADDVYIAYGLTPPAHD